MADGVSSSSGYFIPQLNLLSICACVSSLICIPILCSLFLFFPFIFLGLLYYQDPKIQYQTSKSVQTQRSGANLFHVQAAGNVGAPTESAVTVCLSDVSLS